MHVMISVKIFVTEPYQGMTVSVTIRAIISSQLLVHSNGPKVMGTNVSFFKKMKYWMAMIDLIEFDEWKGLVRIYDSDAPDGPSSSADAPTIKHVHVINGKTDRHGGFLIQTEQTHFIVDSCSSSGVIQGSASGGICGSECSGDILIKHCWSSGAINADSVGGIMGQNLKGTADIKDCLSTGDILGSGSGGICGDGAGREGGKLVITRCFSTGNIDGDHSGGICGGTAGSNKGNVDIENVLASVK